MTTDRSNQMQRAKSSREAGYSLVEILVVLVILSLIMALVAPRVLGYLSRGRSGTADIQIGLIESSLDLYLVDLGRYPSESEGLEALVTAPEGAVGWDGPYLRDGELPQDPWGRPYLYRLSADQLSASVFSYGADGVEGGDGENADIGL